MRLFSFEKLDVWKLSIKLTKLVYRLTKVFPDDEKFGLTSQIRRASVSIASNLAEGSSRISGKEQARFSEISYSSLHEVLNQLIIANELEYISEDELNNFRPLIEEIANKINSLRNYQLTKENK
jgi:four helix bundle protein